MKVIRKILPDVFAGAGAVCIVAALFMVSPFLGLLSAGAALLIGAALLSLVGGAGK